MHGWIFRLILKSTWPIMYRVLRNTHCTLDSSYLDDRNSHIILNHNVLWNETNCRDKVCGIDFFSGNKFNNKLVDIWNNWLKINKNLFLFSYFLNVIGEPCLSLVFNLSRHEKWVILDSMNSPKLVMIDGNIANNDDNMCILLIANYLLFYCVLLSLIVNE